MKKYIVIELQTSADGTVSNIVTAHDTQSQAESKWHTVLAAAAISQLPAHACVLLDSEGMPLDYRCYYHESED